MLSFKLEGLMLDSEVEAVMRNRRELQLYVGTVVTVKTFEGMTYRKKLLKVDDSGVWLFPLFPVEWNHIREFDCGIRNCNFCGYAIADEFKYCAACGKPLSDSIPTKPIEEICKAVHADFCFKFCPECGVELGRTFTVG